MADDDGRSVTVLLSAYDLAQKIGFPVLLGGAGFLVTGHMDQESRLVRIEASRYTVQDARTDRERADADRQGIRELLVRLDARTAGIAENLNKLAETVEGMNR